MTLSRSLIANGYSTMSLVSLGSAIFDPVLDNRMHFACFIRLNNGPWKSNPLSFNASFVSSSWVNVSSGIRSVDITFPLGKLLMT